MIGLGAVGVVLDALPLIIHAIERYKAASQHIKYFRFKEPFIAELIQSLKEQKFCLETDLYITLNATHLEDVEITALLSKPNSRLFQDPEVTHAVQQYLGDRCEPYAVAVARCEQTLADIAKTIRGLASGSQDDLAALVEANILKNDSYEITKKIKFSITRGGLEDRIEDLNGATERLRRVREYSISRAEMTLQSTSRTVAKFSFALNAAREYAHCLYSAVSVGYVVDGHPDRETLLFLQSRSASMENTRRQKLEQSEKNYQPLSQWPFRERHLP